MNTPSNAFLTYNEDLAKKSGGSDFLNDGGAYICTIEVAKYVKANSGSHGIEFSVKTEDGLKANYLTSYYAKQDNSQISGGQSLLSALMGILGAPALTFQQANIEGKPENIVPELQGYTVGLFLQKKLYTKSDGSDGYKFEIRCPYDPATGQTMKEKIEGKSASAISRMTESYKDKDERGQTSQGGYGQAPQGTYPDDFPL